MAAEEMNLQSETFQHLVGEALRAGPGSPQWHDAVQQLRAAGEAGDEYRMLCTVRQRLEAGKGYRAVRAGPAFTARLMQRVQDQSRGDRARRSISVAGTIALISGGAVIVAALCVALLLWRRQPPALPPPSQADGRAGELQGTFFANTVLSTRFEGSIPREWQVFGAIPLDASNGLRPAASVPPTQVFAGGGIASTAGIPASQVFAVEIQLRIRAINDDWATQVLISDRPIDGDHPRPDTAELVWSLQGRAARVVLPGGRVVSPDQSVHPSEQPLVVHLKLDRDLAVVESDRGTLYAGPSQLDPQRARYVAVRFLHRGAETRAPVIIDWIRIQTPQKP